MWYPLCRRLCSRVACVVVCAPLGGVSEDDCAGPERAGQHLPGGGQAEVAQAGRVLLVVRRLEPVLVLGEAIEELLELRGSDLKTPKEMATVVGE